MTAPEPRTEGWSRLWAYGAQHYLVGRLTLCGLPGNAEGLHLAADPAPGVSPCLHCQKRLLAAQNGGR